MSVDYQTIARNLANLLFVEQKKTATIDLEDLAVMAYIILDATPANADEFRQISIPIELEITDDLLNQAIDFILNPPPPPEEP